MFQSKLFSALYPHVVNLLPLEYTVRSRKVHVLEDAERVLFAFRRSDDVDRPYPVFGHLDYLTRVDLADEWNVREESAGFGRDGPTVRRVVRVPILNWKINVRYSIINSQLAEGSAKLESNGNAVFTNRRLLDISRGRVVCSRTDLVQRRSCPWAWSPGSNLEVPTALDAWFWQASLARLPRLPVDLDTTLAWSTRCQSWLRDRRLSPKPRRYKGPSIHHVQTVDLSNSTKRK